MVRIINKKLSDDYKCSLSSLLKLLPRRSPPAGEEEEEATPPPPFFFAALSAFESIETKESELASLLCGPA